MTNRKKLLPAPHTGKLRHHRHTSYGSLALILLMLVATIIAASHSMVSASADPVTADNSIYAAVAGPKPTIAPVVSSVASGTVFKDNNPVTIAGSCPADTLIKVFKNEVFSGAAFCQNNRFSIPIDLFIGTNTIIVRAYNANNDMGPESAPLILEKNVLGVSISKTNQQFFVTSDIFFKGVSVGDTLSWPITISGGQAPYAVSVAWGDGTTNLISRGIAGNFDISHVYQKPGDGFRGSYDVTITATDAIGQTSFIHLVSIIGGANTSVISSVKKGYNLSGIIRTAWQLAVVLGLVILAFWLGERRELQLLRGNLKRI